MKGVTMMVVVVVVVVVVMLEVVVKVESEGHSYGFTDEGGVCWLVGCLTSQQQASVSQGRI